MFNFSPTGYLMPGVKMGSLNLAYEKDDTTNKYSWKKQPRQTAKEQFKKVCEEQQEKIDNVKGMYKPDPTTGKSKKFSASCTPDISLTGGFQMYAQMSYDWEDESWSGDLNALVGGAINASWTIQMVIIVAPAYFTFELGAQLSAGLKFALTSNAGANPADIIKNITFHPGNSSNSIALTISVGVSFGIGVGGAISVYIRGGGYITFAVLFPIDATSTGGKPRFRLGAGIDVSIGFQLLLFSWSGSLWSGEWPELYDSQAKDDAAVQALSSGGDLPLDENGIPQITMDTLAGQMRIVTEGQLGRTVEFRSNGRSIATYANEERPLVEPVDLGDGNQQWDVPLAYGVDEDGVATLADNGQDNLIYIGDSYVNVELPDDVNPKEGEVGIAGIGGDCFGGIRPEADNLIFKNVFSDPRIKLVGNLMFRIATVSVYGDIRTRVAMSNLENRRWTNPLAFEFQPHYDQSVSVDRYDMFDYDFSVCRIDEGRYSYIYLMIVSGTRPHNDSTSFADANAETFINVVRLHLDKKESGSYDDWVYDGALAFKPQVGGGYSSFSSPAMRVSKRYGNNQTCCIVGTSLVRQASTRDGLLNDGATCKLFALYIQHMGISRDDRVLGFRMVTNTFTLPCTGTSTLALGPIAWTKQPSDCHMHIGISSANGVIIERLNITGANTNSGNNPNLSGARLSLSRASRDADHRDVQRLYTTNNDREFYVVRTDPSLFAAAASAGENTDYRRDGRLYLLKFNEDFSYQYVPITPSGTCVPSELTVSKDGRYLFYLVNKEGASSRGFTGEGELGPEKTPEQAKADNSYRIMAMALVDGLFTAPFTLAALNHPVDSIASMTSNGATATIIASQIANFGNSSANIYDIRVPLATVGTIVSVSPQGGFAFAGEKTVFDTAIRNDGNTILTGGTFKLYKVETDDKGNEHINPQHADSTIHVNFQSNLVALSEGEDSSPISTYDMDALPDEYAASPLAAAASEGVLLPGQTVTYRVPFNIPESWASDTPSDGSSSSTVKVRVRFVKPEYLGYTGDATTLAAVNVGDTIEPPVAVLSDAEDEEPWSEDPDFEDLTDEEWQEFIYFLMLLAALNEMDDEDLLDFEIDVLDGGLEPENFDDLFDAEAVSDDEPSDDPGSGGGDGGSGSGGGNGGGDGGSDAGGKGDGSAHRLVDTGDHNIIGKLLFGNMK